MKNLSEELREFLLKLGASVVGFADLNELPLSDRNGYKFGVSFAIALRPEAVRAIFPGPSMVYYNEYIGVSDRLIRLAELGADFLKSKGIDALPLVKSNVVKDDNVFRSRLPFKTVATRAGLGWIGKCAFLVTEQFGPAVRLGVILTNAQLDVGKPINSSRCGKCEECIKMCPANGVSGKNWKVGTDRDELLDAKACKAKVIERGKMLNGLTEGTCGLCIWACPWTQRYLKQAKG
jgi:epoxyqueuosine reductase QueG